MTIRESLRQLPVWMQFCLACLLIGDGLLWVVVVTLYLTRNQ